MFTLAGCSTLSFSGKFYKGGGTAFEPFKAKTKYINLNNRR